MNTKDKLERLREIRLLTLEGGGAERMKRQHDRGKLGARERLDVLLDPGSFVELDRFVEHRSTEFGLDRQRIPGDGVVTGYGTVDGRTVYVFSQDFTVFGGSLSEAHAEKICKVVDLAIRNGSPMVGLNDSGGARIQEGVASLGGYAELFWRNTMASGVVPQISAILGPCAGGAVYSPAITDFVFMVQGISHMFVTGPNVVKTVTHEEVSFEDLGGARVHATTSGVAHFSRPTEIECLQAIRELLSYLPANNTEPPPVRETDDPNDRADQALLDVVPDVPTQPYDMHDVIGPIVDDGGFLEVHAGWAANLITGFARLGGRPVGVIANQPEGRPVRPVLRRVQHPARDFRRCAGLPSRGGPGAWRDHCPRGQAPVRVLRGDGPEADRDHPEGIRRGVRRHVIEAHPGRSEPRLAYGRDRGHGTEGGRRNSVSK